MTGFPNFYTGKIVDDFINILKTQIKKEETNIKNFATFKIASKNARIGRNPKNKKIYKIDSMKSLKISFSKKIIKKLNDM